MSRAPTSLAGLAALDDAALRDHELAALALGLSPAEAAAWLEALDEHRPTALDRRWQATQALGERLRARTRPRATVLDVATAVALFSTGLPTAEVEELHVVGLDTRNRVLVRAIVARGAVNQVMALAREVFRPLVACGAARALVAHNHPSGDPSPSPADAELTARLGVAGELLGIALIDHLILARGGHHSFAEAAGGRLRAVRR
jgi:DNA repair protein RadC